MGFLYCFALQCEKISYFAAVSITQLLEPPPQLQEQPQLEPLLLQEQQQERSQEQRLLEP